MAKMGAQPPMPKKGGKGVAIVIGVGKPGKGSMPPMKNGKKGC